MIIALDGPAGSGKSTIARLVAERAGAFYVNSGNYYRAVTLAALERGILQPGGGVDDLADLRDDSSARGVQLDQLARELPLQVQADRVLIGGRDRTAELRSEAVDRLVAPVSARPAVRHAVNRRLRALKQASDLVVEGRDMTTVVFPEATIKFYLDARPEVRARRRAGPDADPAQIAEMARRIAARDLVDRGKPVGGLRQADDASYLDTSDLTVDEVCEIIVRTIHTHRHQ